MILYLHGFRSSPGSLKARLLAARCAQLGRADAFVCPQLPVSPCLAAQLVHELARQLIKDRDAALPLAQLTLIGSSLGGYYATWLAHQIDCRVVLLNPAVRPQEDLARHLGLQTVYYTEQLIQVEPAFLGELEQLWIDRIEHPDRYLLVAAKGDEVLDWRQMVARYVGAEQLILEGSDHGISDFPRYLDRVLEFCGLSPGAAPETV